jgi:hypothetical protein
MIESKFVEIRNTNNASNFIFGSNFHLSINIETGSRRYLVFKCNDIAKANLAYLANFKNEVERAHFNTKIMQETDIKSKMMCVVQSHRYCFLKRR